MTKEGKQNLERVAIFIDGSNFYFGIKKAGKKTTIDFYKLAIELATTKRKLIRLYYYNAPVHKEEDEEKYKSQQRFFEGLKSTSYVTVRLGRLEKRTTTIKDALRNIQNDKDAQEIIKAVGEKNFSYYVEKGVDVSIAVDMLRLAHQDAYDTAILISADGDFATALEAVKDLGKHAEVAFFKNTFSYHLRNACDKKIYLDDLIERCY